MSRTVIGVLFGVLGFALSAELLFRVLPVSTATQTGYYFDPLILTYPPHHRWRVATGWDLRNPQTLRANNLGFAAEHDFLPDPHAVGLIGDSYVESSMLDAYERPGPQLSRSLGTTRPVYPMGGPGSSLLDYAERLRYAYHRLGVRDFVILMERGDVQQSICGSAHVHGRCLDDSTLALRTRTLPEPSAAKQVLRHSALVQYVFSQLKADFNQIAATAFRRVIPEHPEQDYKPGESTLAMAANAYTLSKTARVRVAAVVDAFFLRIGEVAPHARLVFVVDGGRIPGVAPVSDVQLEMQFFIELARARGYRVVDGVTVFSEHWAQSHLSLSVGPYDGHMNGHAVGLIMRATAQALLESEDRARFGN